MPAVLKTACGGFELGVCKANSTYESSQVVCLDESTAKILNAKAIASRQTPSEIIASMLRKELIVAPFPPPRVT